MQPLSDLMKKISKNQQISREEKESSSQAQKANKLATKPLELTMYRNERNLMVYPFCSTSKRKRLKAIEYRSTDGKRWLQVTANHNFGMAKIWDFDILRFALSKAGEIARHLDYFPTCVEFSVYECLKGLGRNPGSGKNALWLKGALIRLMSTTYRGNIFRDDTKIEVGFTLIKYEYIECEDKNDKIKITFDERLIESVRYQNALLAIDDDVIREQAGIKKRLLELVKVCKGDSPEWTVRLLKLNEMCAHEGELKKFKRLLKSYTLPWKIFFSKAIDGKDKVTFK
jgi:plasmid replication initiation protein